MKNDAKLTPGAKYRTSTKRTIEFLRDEDTLSIYRDEDGNEVPMSAGLFRQWLLRKA